MSTPAIARAPLVGGRLCLDFVNTAGGWTPGFELIDDRLNTYEDLVAWCRYAELVDAQQPAVLLRTKPRGVLARARRLRLAIYRVCASHLGAGRLQPVDLQCISKEAQLFRRSEQIVASKDGFFWTSSLSLIQAILGRIALSAAELLTTGVLQRLRKCPGENCGWLFEDTSRNHSRQWCDMKMCGNLAKVRRFRQRSS